MIERELDPYVWFGEREISPIPRHFVKASTPMTTENNLWVMTRLKGRYGVGISENDNEFLSSLESFFYFEDPGEAMMYELRWSGK